ncbi:hypothetical protein ZWY2020_044341 [Hordeum vulgare]|nr:hypothetical protein ZWY2020_044341 [Hordeum vulgare]
MRAVAKDELESLRNRHAAALADLHDARAELGTLKKERDTVAEETSAAAARVQDTTHEAVQADETPREASAELDVLMAELESARAAHDTMEERTTRLALAWREDNLQWQSELEQGEMERAEVMGWARRGRRGGGAGQPRGRRRRRVLRERGGRVVGARAAGDLRPPVREGRSDNKRTRAVEVHNLSKKVMALHREPFLAEFALLFCSSPLSSPLRQLPAAESETKKLLKYVPIQAGVAGPRHNVTVGFVWGLGADEVLNNRTPEGAALRDTSGRRYDAVANCATGMPWPVLKVVLADEGGTVADEAGRAAASDGAHANGGITTRDWSTDQLTSQQV